LPLFGKSSKGFPEKRENFFTAILANYSRTTARFREKNRYFVTEIKPRRGKMPQKTLFRPGRLFQTQA
jgi:hypothetical protein